MKEGRVTWAFPATWETTKYDETSFYRNQFNGFAGGGNKGVDILAYDPASRTLWMIEAKDFTSTPRDPKKPPLWTEVAEKVRGTLAGLFAAAVRATDAQEQQFARQAMNATSLRVVLHMEQPRKPSKTFPTSWDPADLQQKLRQLVRAVDAHPKVVDHQSSGLPWTAAWSP